MTKKATPPRAQPNAPAVTVTTAPTADAATTTTPASELPEVLPPAVMPVTRLETARALPELLNENGWMPVVHGIQSFKDDDRRTMNVVAVDGMVFKREAAY